MKVSRTPKGHVQFEYEDGFESFTVTHRDEITVLRYSNIYGDKVRLLLEPDAAEALGKALQNGS